MYRKNRVVIGIVLCLALAMIAPAMAQTTTPEAPTPDVVATPAPRTATTDLFATANFRVNVRSGPGTQYTVLDQVRPGDELDITGKLADETWLRVNFDNQEGWVFAGLFDITGDLTTAPEAEAGPTAVLRLTAGQQNLNDLRDVMVITRVNANLRTAPSLDADVLQIIPFNTTFTVTGRTADNKWVQVTAPDMSGWMSSGTLFFSQGNIINVTALDENGSPLPASEQTSTQAAPEPTAAP
jgi:uncharacterized protein YraI